MEAAGPHWCSGAAHGVSIVLLTSMLSPDVDWILNGSLRGFLQAHLRGECAFPRLPVVFTGSRCQVNSTPEPAPLPSPLPPTGGILTHFGPCCLPQPLLRSVGRSVRRGRWGVCPECRQGVERICRAITKQVQRSDARIEVDVMHTRNGLKYRALDKGLYGRRMY
jgi:hypothetical protein